MTHTTTATAMRMSKPNTCLAHTSTLIKLVFVITFFTLLRAAWLLHPSQVTKFSCDFNDYRSTTSTISTLPLTMTVTKTQQIKDTPSLDSRLSKHPKKKPTNTGSVPATLLTLDPTQTAALVSPNGKGEGFLTDNDNEDMLQDTLTEVDLTDNHGAVSNGGTGPKDGLNGLTNESPEVDPDTVLTKVDPTGDRASNKVSKDRSILEDNSNINPTQELFSLPGKVVNYLTGDEAEKAWQGVIPTLLTKSSSNGVLNGSLDVSGSKENPEDVDLCEPEGGTEGALTSESVSNKDGVA